MQRCNFSNVRSTQSQRHTGGGESQNLNIIYNNTKHVVYLSERGFSSQSHKRPRVTTKQATVGPAWAASELLSTRVNPCAKTMSRDPCCSLPCVSDGVVQRTSNT
jgi:hypothetical protein